MRICKCSHYTTVAGENKKRDDCKTKLQTEDYLAQDKQLPSARFTVGDSNPDGWPNSQCTRCQSPQHGRNLSSQKSFHDDLAGEGPGDRRHVPCSEQRDSEQNASQSAAEHRG